MHALKEWVANPLFRLLETIFGGEESGQEKVSGNYY